MPPPFSSFPSFLPSFSTQNTQHTTTTIHPEDCKDDNPRTQRTTIPGPDQKDDSEVRISKNPTRPVGGEGLVGMGGVEKWVEWGKVEEGLRWGMDGVEEGLEGEGGGMVKEEEW